MELELFSNETNAAVVRLPGRRYPGVVIQGDSLRILCDHATEVSELLRAGDIQEAQAVSAGLVELIQQYLVGYEDRAPCRVARSSLMRASQLIAVFCGPLNV